MDTNNKEMVEQKPTLTKRLKTRLINFFKWFGRYCQKKNVRPSFKTYFIDAMGKMALGLFASLLIGTILDTIGDLSHVQFFVDLGSYASSASGAAMAVAIGYALKCPPLVLFSLVAVGISSNSLGGAGGPLSVFFIAIITAEFGKLISGITKIDILITPLLTIIVGCGLAIGIAPWIGKGAYYIGDAINRATDLQPFIMGIIVSVAIGVILTLPISSAAICASFGILGLAGGAALAGCCCQMVGFAVQSFKANKWSGLVSQGIGTSMLQMPNIVKKPIIWLPTILASAITGPIATCVFKLQMNGPAISSGMGTCGLVGPIGVVQGWFNDIDAGLKTNITALDISGLILVSLVLPIVLTLIFHFIFKKFKLYSDDDLKLNL